MKAPRFTILQMMLTMLIFCILGAAISYANSASGEASSLIFLLILVSSPVLLTILVSLLRSFSRRR